MFAILLTITLLQVFIVYVAIRNYDEIRNIRLNPPSVTMNVVYANKEGAYGD